MNLLEKIHLHCSMYTLMVFAALFWSGAFIAGKIAVAEIPSFTLSFLRFTIATICLYPVFYAEEKKPLSKQDIGPLFFLGLTGIFGYHIFFFWSLKHTTAINAALIGATNPLLTSIVASLLVKEHLSSSRIGALFLSFSGVVLIITRGNIAVLKTLSFNKGDILMLIAVLNFVIYSVYSKKVMPRYSPVILLYYSFITGISLLFPFFIYENVFSTLLSLQLKTWLSVIYMGFFASSVAYLIQQMGIKEIGASKTMAFVNLVPLFTMFLSYLILKEAITSITFLSAALIISGIYWNSKIVVSKEKASLK